MNKRTKYQTNKKTKKTNQTKKNIKNVLLIFDLLVYLLVCVFVSLLVYSHDYQCNKSLSVSQAKRTCLSFKSIGTNNIC